MNKRLVENILLLLLIATCIFSNIIINPIGNFDELWNYNFARNIADGLTPYKDFNILQMPLFPFVCSIFLKLIANELIVMRITATILCTGIIYMIYKVFNLLKLDKRISFLFTSAIAFLSADIFCIDYNWATLFVVLNIIYIELKELKNNEFNILSINARTDLILGLLAGICVGFKQTTGIFISVVLLGYKLLIVKNKEDLKIYLKIFLNRIIGILIPIVIMIIYLICSGALREFIDYTILGIKYFNNKILYSNLFSLDYAIKILAIAVPISFIYLYIKTILLDMKKEKDKNLFIIFVYSVSMFIVVYPIADKIHFLIGSIPAIIAILYILYTLLSNKIKLNKTFFYIKEFLLYMATTWIILFSIFCSIQNLYNYFSNADKSTLKHFKYISISKQLEEEVIKVGNYILEQEKEGRKTYILDAYASIYMIPLDKYNKNYDMFLKGNLGDNETEKIINDLKTEENLNILVRKDGYPLNWQTPIDIIKYFRDNAKLEGEISVFNIFSIK